MDRSHERQKKYEEDVENHLQNIEVALAEEINNLKRKIKELTEGVHRSESQERIIEHQRKLVGHEIQNHEDALEYLAEEQKQRSRKHEEIQRQMLEDERETKKTEIENDRLREELDQVTFELKDLEQKMKGIGLGGEKKAYQQVSHKTEQNLEKLEQKKAAQDSSIRRLRKDTRLVEGALQRIEEKILEEIRKQQSQSESLGRKVGIFARERIDAVDEFESILRHLNNEEHGEVKSDRKHKAINYNTGLLYSLLKNDIERMSTEAKKQQREVQKLERDNIALKEKYENMIPKYEELQLLKADKVERDFSPESLVYQEQKKLLRERFSQREKEVDDIFGNYGNTKLKYKRNRMDQRQNNGEDGRLSGLKRELIEATRREVALKARLSKLIEKNNEMQDELEHQRRTLEEASSQVKRIDGDVPEKEVQQLNTVTVSQEEDKTRTTLEKKESELEQILERLELSNQQEQKNLQTLRDTLYTLNSRYQDHIHKRNLSPVEGSVDLRKEIKQLRNEESFLNRTIAQLQRELQLSLIRREAAISKARSVVPLTTNIRGERIDELDSLRRRVEEKRKELEEILIE